MREFKVVFLIIAQSKNRSRLNLLSCFVATFKIIPKDMYDFTFYHTSRNCLMLLINDAFIN